MKTKKIFHGLIHRIVGRTIFKFSNFKIGTLLLLTLFLIFQSCKNGVETAQKQMQKKPPLVKVQAAGASKMVSYVDITGTVEANIFTDVKAPADGILELLAARENQRVEKDKIIAVINPTDRVSLISSNQLQIEQIQQKVKAAGNNSEEKEKLALELEKAKSNLEYAENMYQTIPVICPMSGLVTQRWTDLGSQVSAKDKILTISDMNSLVIKAEVNEKFFEAIKQGKKLPVILNAYPNDTLSGIISLLYPQIDPVTRGVKFDVKIQNFNKSLLPGMMASIKIPVSAKENAVSVPEQAVLTSPDNKNFLFVIDTDSIAHRKVVETGIVSGNKLEIVKGLNINEKVVIAGQEMLKDSLKVIIMKK